MVSTKNSKLDFSQKEKQQQKQKQLFKAIYADATSSEKLETSHASIPDKTEKNPSFWAHFGSFLPPKPQNCNFGKIFFTQLLVFMLL